MKSQIMTFGYGKPWSVPVADAPDDYYFDEADTTDALSGEAVDFENKTVHLYYAPVVKKIMSII